MQKDIFRSTSTRVADISEIVAEALNDKASQIKSNQTHSGNGQGKV